MQEIGKRECNRNETGYRNSLTKHPSPLKHYTKQKNEVTVIELCLASALHNAYMCFNKYTST